jgi:hypothetical protein
MGCEKESRADSDKTLATVEKLKQAKKGSPATQPK